MKKLAIAVLSTGALAVAAGLATSYYMGQRIEQAVKATAQAWSTDAMLDVRVLEYRRGIVGSHAVSQWSFAGEEDSYDITVTHAITHGPWPWGQAAQMVSTFHLPDSSEEALQQALQDQAPLQWHVTAQWDGVTQHQLSAPEFEVQFEDQSTLTWGGLQAQWSLSATRDAAKGFVHMPLMRTQVEDGNQLEWQAAQLAFDVRVADGHRFWQGPTQLKIERLVAQEPATATEFELHNWQVDSRVDLQDSLAQIALQSHIARFDMPEYSARNLQLDMQLKQLDAHWLDQFMQWFQANEADNAQTATLLWQLWEGLPSLLAAQPEFAIEHLGLETDDGPAQLSAHVRYIGNNSPSFDPATDVQAVVRAELPRPMLMQLLEAKVRSDYLALLDQLGQDLDTESLQASVEDGAQKRLQALLRLGAVQESAAQYKAELVLEQGQLQLNGQPTEWHILLQLGEAM